MESRDATCGHQGQTRMHLGCPCSAMGLEGFPSGGRDRQLRQPQTLVLAALKPKGLGQASSYRAELVGIPQPHIRPPSLLQQGPALPDSPHCRQDLGLPGRGWRNGGRSSVSTNWELAKVK